MARDYAAIIAALLANAEDEGNTEAARQAYRDKAETMMREYRIAQEDAIAADPGTIVPIRKDFSIRVDTNLASRNFPGLIYLIADHCEILVKTRAAWDAQGHHMINVSFVGYDMDVRYAEFLWTSTYLMFSTRIDPTWAADRTEAENIYLMRQAGIERRVIADRAWGMHAGSEAKNRSKVQRVYLAEVARRGEVPVAAGLGFNTKLYREAYAQQFATTLSSRLWSARNAANAAGGAMVMADRENRVKEAYYEFFPNARPRPTTETAYVDPRETCDRCKGAKSGFCRDHSYLKPSVVTKADRDRWDRQANSSSARAGMSSGRDAARGVVIQRGTPETGKMGPAAQHEIG